MFDFFESLIIIKSKSYPDNRSENPSGDCRGATQDITTNFHLYQQTLESLKTPCPAKSRPTNFNPSNSKSIAVARLLSAMFLGQRMTWRNNLKSSRRSCWNFVYKKLQAALPPNSPRCQQIVAIFTGFNLIFSNSNSVRKSIARVLTVTNQKARHNLREFYKNKKYLPLDLRTKKTRAIRRRLTAVCVLNDFICPRVLIRF